MSGRGRTRGRAEDTDEAEPELVGGPPSALPRRQGRRAVGQNFANEAKVPRRSSLFSRVQKPTFQSMFISHQQSEW